MILTNFHDLVFVLDPVCGEASRASWKLLCDMMMRINSAGPSPQLA